MKLLSRSIASVILAASAMLGFAADARAQDFPTRPIRFILPYGPGISTDVLARIVAAKVAERTGWTTIVENKPGGRFVVGAQEVLKAPADGHTIFVIGNSIAVLAKVLSFDIVKDFAPVTRLSNLNLCIVTSPKAPYKTVAELIAYAKANPGTLNFAGSERGSNNHLAGELIKQITGIDMQHIPYKDSSYIGDLVAGRTQLGIMTVTSVSSVVTAGTLRGIAVLGAERDPLFPTVPTFAESGFPVLNLDAGNGFMVKAGTPVGIINRLNKELTSAIDQPDVKERFAKMGAIPQGGSPQAYASKITSDIELWQKVMTDAKISIE